MEVTNVELKAIELVSVVDEVPQLQQLTELELCLAGGGQGDVSLG